ncbi:MAG: MFS transporter [Muribaculaceae bacterium]|nr:MFS transporter [Muribaculaceae bacterium]
MAQKTKQWAAIIMMIALFAMIAFVTNLCSPMATIVKNQFGASETAGQIGNYANFIAYLLMGIPSGMLISKFGYKKTALAALVVGLVGLGFEYLSGQVGGNGAYWVYLLGAFISGMCMCMLNTVVNPLLNVLGGGGKTGNQLIQIGGAFNSAAAVAVYILMGALIGEVTKETSIVDATPALAIAAGIFVVALVVLIFTKIEEPEQAPVQLNLITGALKFKHFALGALAIFLYMSVEVGTPTYMISYLQTPEIGVTAGVAALIASVYWLMMFVGRTIGGAIGGKVSSRAMVSTVAAVAIVLLLFGIFAPSSIKVEVPGIDWANLSVIWTPVPVGVFAFILVGLCTSVMWGGIFNMAVEGLGKYTAAASGIFMTMVFGCAVMVALQAVVADHVGILVSYFIPVACAAYILFYALIGSKVKSSEEKE